MENQEPPQKLSQLFKLMIDLKDELRKTVEVMTKIPPNFTDAKWQALWIPGLSNMSLDESTIEQNIYSHLAGFFRLEEHAFQIQPYICKKLATYMMELAARAGKRADQLDLLNALRHLGIISIEDVYHPVIVKQDAA